MQYFITCGRMTLSMSLSTSGPDHTKFTLLSMACMVGSVDEAPVL